MKLIKIVITISLIAAALIPKFMYANILPTTSCPNGTLLQFHALATKYVGYYYGNTSDGTAIESANMSIPYQFYNDGYTVQFNNKIIGNSFVTCVYYLQNNATKIKSPLFGLSSSIHH